MNKVLDRVKQAEAHLRAIEDYFLQNVPAYVTNEQRLEGLGRFYSEFARELYVGGRKGGKLRTGDKFHRGLILADLLTYAVFGRGYYIIAASDEHRAAFIQIVLGIVNKLLLQENISANVKLRNGLLDALQSLGLPNFFEDDSQKKKFRELRRYRGAIIWKKKGEKFYKMMDAVLPKSRGLAIEFLIYLYLIHRRFGFVIPLLFQQKLVSKDKTVTPPDFFVLKSDGRVFGIEVGYLKEEQCTEFVTATSVPTIAAELDEDQPFRCPKCNQWITYCTQVIESYSQGISAPNPFSCSGCKYFDNGKCPDIIFFGKVPEVEDGQRRFHYRCVADEKSVKALAVQNTLAEHLKVWFPLASMIDALADKTK